MAVDLCSSPSPRLTFPHDPHQQLSPTSSPPDFHFCTPSAPSSTAPADELFSSWKLLHPLPAPPPKETPSGAEPPPPSAAPIPAAAAAPKPSFWSFRRSSSFSANKPGGLLSSLHLLPRSLSAGSSPAPPPPKQPRRPSISATHMPKSLRKSPSASNAAPFPPQGSSYYYGSSRKATAGAAVRISPVLNVPPQCFASGSGTGFFHFLCGCGKEKPAAVSAPRKKAMFSAA